MSNRGVPDFTMELLMPPMKKMNKPQDLIWINVLRKHIADQGVPSISLRHAYYYLLSNGYLDIGDKSQGHRFKNHNTAYERVEDIIKFARDKFPDFWDKIVDTSRRVDQISMANNLIEFLKAKVKYYHRDLWKVQDNFVMVILEKDAESDNVWRGCGSFGVPIVISRGFMSWGTFYHDVVKKLLQYQSTHELYVLVLSDFDPEGELLYNDLKQGFKRAERKFNLSVPEDHIKKIALNYPQIVSKNKPQLDLKPLLDTTEKENKAKFFTDQYGFIYCELEALEPIEIRDIVFQEVTSLLELQAWQLENKKEKFEKETVRIKCIVDPDQLETMTEPQLKILANTEGISI